VGDFEVFSHTGDTLHIWGEIWRKGYYSKVLL